MQPTNFITATVILAMASTGMAICKYRTSNYQGICSAGNQIYCKGSGACHKGEKTSYDSHTDKLNVDVCSNSSDGPRRLVGDTCSQTVKCC
ncbi:uncharacterized protein RSE6_14595 [Rhynchosporium secalis]|uniref:Uncharacterized protein n=1 Tax=Rhynchosporium secalis TaxID=38038 RepID=A0A1E1MVM6_RHYSE|nr:uncharacterized protein RSE6_14595 [Rhynchosporium secalis]